MTDYPSDNRPVEELESAVEQMKQAKQRNLYDHRSIRFGLAKNIRLHENALDEPQQEKDDARKEYVKRDEKGHRILLGPDGRHVIELEEGEYVYKESAEPYVSEEEREQQIEIQGKQISRARYKQQSLRRAFEDVEALNDKIDEINSRKIGVTIHVLDGGQAERAVRPDVSCNEEEFLYLFHDFREVMGLDLGGFEPADLGPPDRVEEPEGQEPAPETANG
ncbi:hypothetical protein [Salinibacter altiplanensis]|uniref:hypothetical protein n=1 Tax=Salinibacter altiplanensis TaxID=1803181 RepID=UPI000C9FA74B|nr:hypothetical protein [Salinibacter altiplanensis]